MLMMAMGAVLYGSIALLPLFLQTLLGYSAMQSGLTTSPRGFGSIVGMIIIGRVLGFVDGRWLIAIGFSLLAFSTWQFGNLKPGHRPLQRHLAQCPQRLCHRPGVRPHDHTGHGHA
jgi:hypothetical protein